MDYLKSKMADDLREALSRHDVNLKSLHITLLCVLVEAHQKMIHTLKKQHAEKIEEDYEETANKFLAKILRQLSDQIKEEYDDTTAQ